MTLMTTPPECIEESNEAHQNKSMLQQILTGDSTMRWVVNDDVRLLLKLFVYQKKTNTKTTTTNYFFRTFCFCNVRKLQMGERITVWSITAKCTCANRSTSSATTTRGRVISVHTKLRESPKSKGIRERETDCGQRVSDYWGTDDDDNDEKGLLTRRTRRY